MGILSWQGRNGDAGKTTGWSPDEPTCRLDVTPERFLQFVVYPHVQDADPTSWSHALPVGRWTQVVIVNDGHHTVLYVDDSKIARNPSQPSTGIATLGNPFVIGATQFDEKFGQGFYGWIGDTLAPSPKCRSWQVFHFRSGQAGPAKEFQSAGGRECR
ncbi:LamG-like jellyroll fold domain-containing protein [Stenotrophomonas sp. NPDC087984]